MKYKASDDDGYYIKDAEQRTRIANELAEINVNLKTIVQLLMGKLQ